MSGTLQRGSDAAAWVVRHGLCGPEATIPLAQGSLRIPVSANGGEMHELLMELGLERDPSEARRTAALIRRAAQEIEGADHTLLRMGASGAPGAVETLHVERGDASVDIYQGLKARGVVLESQKDLPAAYRTVRALLLNQALDDSTRLATSIYVLNEQRAGSIPYRTFVRALFNVASEAAIDGDVNLATSALEFFDRCHEAFLTRCSRPWSRANGLLPLLDEHLAVLDARIAESTLEESGIRGLANLRRLAFSLRSKLAYPVGEDSQLPGGNAVDPLWLERNTEIKEALPRWLRPLQQDLSDTLNFAYHSAEMKTALEEVTRSFEFGLEELTLLPDVLRNLGDYARESLRANKPLAALSAMVLLRSLAGQLHTLTEQRDLCVELVVSSMSDMALCFEDLFAQKYSRHMNPRKDRLCVIAHLGVALIQSGIAEVQGLRGYECTSWRSRVSATTDLPGAKSGRNSFLAGVALVSVREALKSWELAMEGLARERAGTPDLFGKDLYFAVSKCCSGFVPASSHGLLLMGLNSALRIPVQHGQGLSSMQVHFEQLCVINRFTERYLQITNSGAPHLRPRKSWHLQPHALVLDDNVRGLHAEIAEVAKGPFAKGDYREAVREAFAVIRENLRSRAALHGVESTALALFEPYRGPEKSSLHGGLGVRHGWIKIIDSALELEAAVSPHGGRLPFGPLDLRDPRDALAVLSLASLIQRQLNPAAAGSDPTPTALYNPEHSSVQLRSRLDRSELRPNRTLLRGLHHEIAGAVEALWELTNRSGAVYHVFTVLDQRLRAVAQREKTGSKLVEDLLGGEAPPLGGILPSEQRRAILEFYRGAYGLARNALAHRKQENQGEEFPLAGLALGNYALHLVDFLQNRSETHEWTYSPEQSEALLTLLRPELYVTVRQNFLSGQYAEAVEAGRQLLIARLCALKSDKEELEALLSDICVDKPKLTFGPSPQDGKHGRDLLLGILKLSDAKLAAHPANDPWNAFEQLKLLNAALIIVDAASQERIS